MAIVITVSNQKGGVGKTTTSAALAAGLAENGKKILGIDLDPQGNFGFCMGSEEHSDATIRDVLIGSVSVQKAIRRVDRYDLLTSDILLGGSDLELKKTSRKEAVLKEALEPVMDFYDYIIIDTPPALNLLTVNAYGVSDYLIIPMGTDILSLVGLSQLKETFDTVKTSLNKDLKVLGILLTRYDGRTNLSKDVSDMAQKLAESMQTKVFKSRIRSSIAIAEAPAQGESIFEYSPHAGGVRDYVKFVREVKKTIEEDSHHGKEKQ